MRKILLALILFPIVAEAYITPRVPPFHIYAKKISYNWEKKEVIAEGDAEIVGRGYRIMGERIIYNFLKKEFRATGKVVLEKGDMQIEGENLWINMERNVGYIENGSYFSKKGYFGRGKRVVKLSNGDIWIENGSFTSCDPLKPTWLLEGREITIKKGGYLVAKKLKIYVAGRKVITLPYGIIPITKERKTGLLPPRFGSSNKKGIYFEQDLFYTMGNTKDFTITGGFEGKRGGKLGLEFRYNTGEGRSGKLWSLFSSNRRRWGISGDLMWYERRENMKITSQFFLTSDNDFPSDFAEKTGRFIENRFFLRKDYKFFTLTEGLTYIDRLDGSNTYTFSYYPEVSASSSRVLGGWRWDGEISFKNFSREKGYKGWRTTGLISVRRNVKSIKIFGGGLARYYKMYRFDKDSIKNALFYSGARYSKSFIYTREWEEKKILTVITPFSSLFYISPVGSPPIFDGRERIPEGLYVNYGFSGEISLLDRDLLSLSIYQTSRLDDRFGKDSYDISLNFLSDEEIRTFERTTGKRLSEIIMDLEFSPLAFSTLRFSGSIDPYKGLFRRGELFTDLTYKPFSLGFRYTYLRDISEEINFNGSISLSKWAFSSFYSYLISSHRGGKRGFSIMYRPGCYSLTLSLVSTLRPHETKFNLGINIRGIGGSPSISP